ncbi:ribonuclease R [Luteimonas sp. JM171]|uniref:ribonuclease R n=1 Tax=Luteimonas sp. JM171 TaxID=1896164 RepID=UPI00085601D0|nr:ribonuclease R [Luteimonas sp. JM171]
MAKPPGKRGRSRTSKDHGNGGEPTRGKGQRNKGAGGRKLPPWMPDVASAPPRDGKPMKDVGKPRRDAKGRIQDPYAEREAGRYENPIPSREAILATLTEAEGPQKSEEIAAMLGLTEPDRFDALEKRLAAMVRDGQLLRNRRGGHVPAGEVELISGTVIANPDGFGFLRPDSGAGDDLFLPPYEMRKAMHGDRVMASVSGVDSRGRREGVIVEVLERRATRLLGRFNVEAGISFVVPDDKRILRNVQIPHDATEDAKHGQLVVCEIVHPPDTHRPPIGRVLSVLGDVLKPSLVVEAAIHGHGLPYEFPQQVLDEAAAIPVDVGDAEIRGRRDLRKLPLVTIDGEDAKDFDDAVYCEADRDGFRLVVAIADVSHYVRPEQPLDDEAQLRATSVYFPGFVIPMLPETLSNGICSLKPRVDRLCFVCDMRVGRDGTVHESEFYEAVMHSHARLTYTQVWDAIGEDDPQAQKEIGKLMPQIRDLHRLYKALARARARRGAIEFETSEVRFELDNRGEVVRAGMLQRNDAHKLIEECMIAANVEAARFLLETDIPAPYRIHDKPPESKYLDLLEFLKEFQLRMPAWGRVRPKDFANLLNRVRERPEGPLIESVLLRSQSLAVYSVDNIGHFGLALEAYAHFTSPIRRYPDLLVHRAIKHALAGKKAHSFKYTNREMMGLALQSSEKARRADEASREVDDRYRAAWMEEHVGREFDGVISGVTSFGLFVELDESKVNGLVHVTQLPHDFYRFDPVRRTLTGDRRGREYRLGDRARVRVLKASLEERKIDFAIVEEGQPQGQKAPRPPKDLTERGKPAKRQKKPY